MFTSSIEKSVSFSNYKALNTKENNLLLKRLLSVLRLQEKAEYITSFVFIDLLIIS